MLKILQVALMFTCNQATTRPLSILTFCLLIFSPVAGATVQNFSGIYEGNTTSVRFNCNASTDNGTFTEFDIITFVQNGSRVTGTVTNNNSTTTISGSVTDSGQFTATFTDNSGDSGTVSGTFSTTQLQFSATTLTTNSNSGCFSDISGTLTKTSGGGSVSSAAAITEQSSQVIRATTTLISQHLAGAVASAFSFTPAIGNKASASADQEQESPISFWGTSALSEIHEDSGTVANFDTDIYQFVGGFDKKIGKFFVGSALTYVYAETEQTGQDSSSHVFGITPYGAYQITDFMFISALAGYNYTHITDEVFNTDTDVHDYILESDLNFYKTFFNAIIVKSRIGTRFHHTYVSSLSNGLDASTDELIWLGDFELGYRFQNQLTTYVGTYYEYFDRESSSFQIKEHDGILFIRGGISYPLTNNLTLGGTVQADLTDEDTDIITGSINIRLAM